MSYREIGQTLIDKLTPGELSQLVDAWDDGGLDDIMEHKLIPQDAINNPDKYVDED